MDRRRVAGRIVTDLPAVARSTPEEARRRADRIRAKGQELYEDIVVAYQGRDWEALGYGTWDDYLTGEFRHAPLALPREERPAQVASLREKGLSLRAIAAATGVSRDTAQKDLAKTPVRNLTPDDDPEPIQGIDGKHYPAAKPDPFAALVSDYPEAKELPKRARAEAVAGHQALAKLPEPERPRREANFTKWIRAQVEAGETPPTDHRRVAATAAHDATVALANVVTVANRFADHGNHFDGIEADWSDLLSSARSAIDRIEAVVLPTTELRRIK